MRIAGHAAEHRAEARKRAARREVVAFQCGGDDVGGLAQRGLEQRGLAGCGTCAGNTALAPRSTASISDRPVPHSRRSVEVRPWCAVSQRGDRSFLVADRREPRRGRLRFRPTCQPCTCEPTSSATPRPVPGPSTLTGPRSAAAGSPCKVTQMPALQRRDRPRHRAEIVEHAQLVEAQRALQFAAAERPRAIGQADLVVADRAGDRERGARGVSRSRRDR